MHNIHDFIAWALTHAKRESIPEGAQLPVAREECGTEKWEYLYGSTRVQTNKDTLDRYFNEHYYKNMSREKYDSYTKNWPEDGYATDCQGLLDAYMTYVLGEKTDINADMNYKYWCEDTGEIEAVSRDFVLGEAVFMKNENTGKMNHVGWVCGFMPSGEPLIVEARGIAYGVVVTRFNSRAWTHCGLMTKKFDYSEPQPAPTKTRFEITSPYQRGMAYKKMQDALDDAGYTDADGKRLEIDGIWGPKSQQALDTLVADYAAVPEPVPIAVLPPTVGRFDLEDAGLTVCIFRTADMPPDAENGVKKA